MALSYRGGARAHRGRDASAPGGTWPATPRAGATATTPTRARGQRTRAGGARLLSRRRAPASAQRRGVEVVEEPDRPRLAAVVVIVEQDRSARPVRVRRRGGVDEQRLVD